MFQIERNTSFSDRGNINFKRIWEEGDCVMDWLDKGK